MPRVPGRTVGDSGTGPGTVGILRPLLMFGLVRVMTAAGLDQMTARLKHAVMERHGIESADLFRIGGFNKETLRVLNVLESSDVISSKAIGAYRHFYPSGTPYTEKERLALAFLNKRQEQRVLLAIQDNQGITAGRLLDATGMTETPLLQILGRLIEIELVKSLERNNEPAYYVPDYQTVDRMRIRLGLAVPARKTMGSPSNDIAENVPPEPGGAYHNKLLKSILDVVAAGPGLNISAISKGVNIRIEQARRLLLQLEGEGKVEWLKDGASRRFFLTSMTLTEREKNILIHLHQPTTRAILDYLIDRSSCPLSNLYRDIGLARERIKPKLTELSKDRLLDRTLLVRKSHLQLLDGKTVREMLGLLSDCPKPRPIFRWYKPGPHLKTYRLGLRSSTTEQDLQIVLETIKNKPGIDLHKIREITGLGLKPARKTLWILEDEELIWGCRMDLRKGYFSQEIDPNSDEGLRIRVLANPNQGLIIHHIFAHPGSYALQIARATGQDKAVVFVNIRKMKRMGILRAEPAGGNRVRLFLKEPEEWRKLICGKLEAVSSIKFQAS